MKRVSQIFKCFILLFFFSFFLIACTGPKFMSTVSGSQENWGKHPTIQSISISPLAKFAVSDSTMDPYTPRLLENLKERMGRISDVRKIVILSPTDSIQTPYLLEISVMNTGKAGWGDRANNYGSQSEVSVAGRLIDVKADKALITFRKTRMAQGGMLGIGGWLSAGEKQMSRKLIDWLADDVVTILFNNTPGTSVSNSEDLTPTNLEEF